LGEEEIEEVVSCLRSGWIGTGPRVARFEEDFKRYKKCEHAVAVNSCTAALHLSLIAAGIGPGDEVIVPALTFCATINAVCHVGATPVLADVDDATMNIDPVDVASKLSAKTRALIPVHFAGRPCSMRALMEIVDQNGLTLVEDCAHAIESEYGGRKAGTFGDFGCFSFYATKNVTTAEGGMVLVKSADDAARLKRLALHGLSSDAWRRYSDDGYRHYLVTELGYKSNMTDLQAALGIHQLARVNDNWERRQKIWEYYKHELRDLPIGLPKDPEPDTKHAYHLFPIQLDPARSKVERDEFLRRMTRENIGVGVHYLSIAEHPYYKSCFGWRTEDYPNSMTIGRTTVSLPLTAGLENGDLEDVVCAVRRSL
jgi:dTDP-4-amino-4,6-dideoxygalactose transaminase